jgi:Bacterial extracellular solute-binding protein
MNSRVVGAFVVILMVGAVWYYTKTSSPGSSPATVAASLGLGSSKPRETVAVRGYIGGEKVGLMQDPKLRDILERKYGINLTAERRGSLQMVTTEPLEGIDFVWPGSQTQVEVFHRSGRAVMAEEVLFVSPIVIFSWDLPQAGLTKAGIVRAENGTYFISDMPRLAQAIVDHAKWRDLGVPELFGSIKVTFTDPQKSNSGAQYLALMGTILAGGDALTSADVATVAPKIKAMVEAQGMLPASSGDLFSQYLKQGVGAFPLVAGYENQLIEFAVENPDFAKQIQQKLRIMYPVPTVWSTHPMIALSKNGRRLLEAMRDPEIQAIAWTAHGFRTEKATITSTPVPGLPNLPSNIIAVVPMPSVEVLDQMLPAPVSY